MPMIFDVSTVYSDCLPLLYCKRFHIYSLNIFNMVLKSFHNFLIWIKSNLQVKKVLVVALMNAWGAA